ncbi:hypothetical protein [Leeia oryzae]|uniref:hypothetical protein n=1 Tax=Leeia oryzae TaxID=356662 RepID=UPI00036CDF60|nr:hypothetical protein [Leeia oryzae]
MTTESAQPGFIERHKRKLIGLGIFLLLDMSGIFDMLQFHTGSLLPPYLEQRQEWRIPTDPRLKRQYDEAQAIVLPDSIPKPVPFNFALARLRAAIPGQPSVSTQYFRHLCKTEANEYILKKVQNVEGLLQMRTRPMLTDQELGKLYEIEDPFGYDIQNTVNSSHFVWKTEYQYIEQPLPGDSFSEPSLSSRDISYKEPINPKTNYFIYSPIKEKNYKDLDYIRRDQSSTFKSRYGFTWRGIHRKLDRYYMIAGGEIIIKDLKTNEVLAVKRGFRRALWDDGNVGWQNGAGDCPRYYYGERMYQGIKPLNKLPIPDVMFVDKVLIPVNSEKTVFKTVIDPKKDNAFYMNTLLR